MDQKDIKDLMRSFDKSSLSKFKLKDGDFEISFQKGTIIPEQETVQKPVVIQQQSVQETVQETANPISAKDENATYIKSPMVGTFYEAPSPGSPAFVQVGDTVKKDTAVAIIEAMKIMNEIEAGFDCKIVKILVNDGEPVEYDQPLFLVEKL